jgi:hypothetical protein
MVKNNFLAVTLLGWLAVLTSGYATDSSEKVSFPVVPDAVKISANEELLFTAKAQGVQIYKCQAKKDDPTQYEWVFVAPKADLFDAHGKKIGRHYAGPTWESNDGSQVVGEVKGHVPSNDNSAVPWLLLAAKKHAGNGVFSQVTSIQRLETVGGKAPTGGCSQASVGKELRVPYTAVYYFYVSKP